MASLSHPSRFWLLTLIVVIGLAGSFVIPLPSVAASSITLAPAGSKVEINSSWTTVVSAQAGVKVNAVDVTVTFPADVVSVTSVSTDDSAFGIVVFQPKVDNSAGTVRFIQASPQAYQGPAGKIGQITFKAKKAGQVHLGVGAAKMVAADGKGSNVYDPYAPKTVGQLLVSVFRQ